MAPSLLTCGSDHVRAMFSIRRHLKGAARSLRSRQYDAAAAMLPLSALDSATVFNAAQLSAIVLINRGVEERLANTWGGGGTTRR